MIAEGNDIICPIINEKGKQISVKSKTYVLKGFTNEDIAKQCLNMGICPGVQVTLLQSDVFKKSHIIAFGNTQIALRNSELHAIVVE